MVHPRLGNRHEKVNFESKGGDVRTVDDDDNRAGESKDRGKLLYNTHKPGRGLGIER